MLEIILSNIIPLFILSVIVVGVAEKQDVFRLFLDGVNDGLKVIIKIFPSVMAIIIAINLLNETKVINYLLMPISNLIERLNVPKPIIPLVVLRPLSGSASTALVIDIFAKFGPDSIEGLMASIIMASSETTFYVIAVLFGANGIKKAKGTTVAAVAADVFAVIITIIIVNFNFIK